VTGQVNEFGQPIGQPLLGWSPPPFPSSKGLTGRLADLVPIDAVTHGPDLVAAFDGAPDSLWTYMPIGPFADGHALTAAVDGLTGLPDRQPYAIVVDGAAQGFASYLRVDRPNGVLEVGSIALAPALQRTTAATEALFLMIDHAFELGYRRCEWKCDDLNAPSRAAALRLGFRYEGTFRQATHYKERNRDTAWYAIVDAEWPDLRRAFETWLSPANFDERGTQRAALAELRERT
jgi:RimJ/RimL family protein N-acetyltransferase